MGTHNIWFMENCGQLSKHYHQLPTLSVPPFTCKLPLGQYRNNAQGLAESRQAPIKGLMLSCCSSRI